MVVQIFEEKVVQQFSAKPKAPWLQITPFAHIFSKMFLLVLGSVPMPINNGVKISKAYLTQFHTLHGALNNVKKAIKVLHGRKRDDEPEIGII